MRIEIQVLGLDYLQALLDDQKTLIAALERNAQEITKTVTQINAKELEKG